VTFEEPQHAVAAVAKEEPEDSVQQRTHVDYPSFVDNFLWRGLVAKDFWVHQGFVSFLDWDYTIKSFKQWLLNG